MLRLSFKTICRKLAKCKLPKFSLVVGIAEGGIVPASLVAVKLNAALKIIQLNYRNEHNNPRYPDPVLLHKARILRAPKEILVVDDAAISGKTLAAAKKLFKGHKVKTMVFKGRADYVLFPRLKACVRWPWKI
jgi:adenine/guanine phosphoribosyltransferase-like PRPP-binding protein